MKYLLTASAARIFLFALPLLILVCTPGSLTLKKDDDINQYKRMYESNDWTERKNAVSRISRILTPEAEEMLLKATYDTHAIIRMEALAGFRRQTPMSALFRVKELAETENDINVRWHALKTLGYYRDPASALIFARNLKNDDWLIREESIKGLLKIDDYAIRFVSVPYVIQALGDESVSVKLATLKYLRVKDPRIYSKLSVMLITTHDGQQALIVETLKALRGYDLDSKTMDKVIGYLTHQNMKIRLNAHRVLLARKEHPEDHKKAPSN